MKTERNGILETAWRKFKAFVNTPLFDFLLSWFLLIVTSVLVAFGMELFPSFDSVPCFIAAGVFFSWCCGSFFSFMDFLSHCKPSAEADKNKNENKE